ncbi:hypothetical protein [Calothrix sp. PCC 6303]|uniref:hypothetical protein n=1 Tax=Calothrix sp. PCC 6303 TaxID=1170562 RepID=UPI0002A01D8A|nr:hypothetical protein [Calothrix sp. PCC 6303]AFZ02127.1 hypothetical protein Cal6303_3186 [Calothrix sp. PCC 6303]
MNAAEMATNLEFASKIATAINLFKREFPDAKSDLKPWNNDPDTRELIDPDSIDIGFHFPGISRSWRSRSLLFQIRFHHDEINNSLRAIGVEVSGFDHRGEAWKLSTVENWTVFGETRPKAEICEKLKQLCFQIIEIFNRSAN